MVKKSTSSSTKQTVPIIKPLKEDTISISVRLPKTLHSRFTTVKQLIEKYGYTISITDVVQNAIQCACESAILELEEKGINVRQEELPL